MRGTLVCFFILGCGEVAAPQPTSKRALPSSISVSTQTPGCQRFVAEYTKFCARADLLAPMKETLCGLDIVLKIEKSTKTDKDCEGGLLMLEISNHFADTVAALEAGKILEMRADYDIEAAEIKRAYEKKKYDVGEFYKHKIMIVSGTIAEVGKDAYNDYYVMLGGRSAFDVRCLLSKEQYPAAQKLVEGQQLKVKGFSFGSDSNGFELDYCVIVPLGSKETEQSATSEPSSAPQSIAGYKKVGEVVISEGVNVQWAAYDNGGPKKLKEYEAYEFTLDQEEAQIYCKDLVLSGYKDWRLPTMKELLSLFDRSLPGYKFLLDEETKVFIPELIQVSGNALWSSEHKGSEMYMLDISSGHMMTADAPMPVGDERALCVRSLATVP